MAPESKINFSWPNLTSVVTLPLGVHRLPRSSSLCIFIVETKRGARMQVRVQKWGNSLAVRIPKPLAEDAEVKEGTVLNLAVSDGKVLAIPIAKRKLSLKQMLAKVTRKNLRCRSRFRSIGGT